MNTLIRSFFQVFFSSEVEDAGFPVIARCLCTIFWPSICTMKNESAVSVEHDLLNMQLSKVRTGNLFAPQGKEEKVGSLPLGTSGWAIQFRSPLQVQTSREEKLSGTEWIPSCLWGSEHLCKQWWDWKTTVVFTCNPSLPYYDAHIVGKEKRMAAVSVPPSSLFPGQLEFTQVKTFVVTWKMVNSALLCLQREAQLHRTFHPVTPCLIKISVAKLSPLKISYHEISWI